MVLFIFFGIDLNEICIMNIENGSWNIVIMRVMLMSEFCSLIVFRIM